MLVVAIVLLLADGVKFSFEVTIFNDDLLLLLLLVLLLLVLLIFFLVL